MSEEKKTMVTSVFDMVSKIQRVLFYGMLFIIPWFVIPLPYDSTEKIKSILFIILSSLLILLEVIKWIWDGKISVTKSPIDKVFLLLFISFLLGTVFARDTWMSFWGYDGRMGTGLFVMIFLFLFFFLSTRIFPEKRRGSKCGFLIINGYIRFNSGKHTVYAKGRYFRLGSIY